MATDPNFDPAYFPVEKDLSVDSNGMLVNPDLLSAALLSGTAIAARQQVVGSLTVAGTVTFTMSDGSLLPLALQIGYFSEKLSVTKAVLSGGAAGSFYSMK